MRFSSKTLFSYSQTRFLSFSIFILLILSSRAFAETMYVSDFLIFNIKDNIEQPFNVVATVQSDQPLEIQEESGRYFKVKTETGEIGWIAKQYLKKSLPKALIISQLENEITQLKEKLSALEKYEALDLTPDKTQQAIIDLQAENGKLGNELKVLSDSKASLEQELERLKKLEVASQENIDLLTQYENAQNENTNLQNTINEQLEQLAEAEKDSEQLAELKTNYEELLFTSQNAEAIAKEKKTLEQKNTENQAVIMQLQQQVSAMKNNQMIYWFLAGAAVFLVGMIFGKINIKKKKRLSL